LEESSFNGSIPLRFANSASIYAILEVGWMEYRFRFL
jgi:hypothetical protein